MRTNIVFEVKNLFDQINRHKSRAFLALAGGDAATEEEREELHQLTVCAGELYALLLDADEPCDDAVEDAA